MIHRVVSELKCPAAEKPRVGWDGERPLKFNPPAYGGMSEENKMKSSRAKLTEMESV